MDFELTIYDDDDVTPLFAVATSAAHANPYLQHPGEFSESEVDLARGTAHIGFGSVGIIDPQTGATKDIRWLTARLGNTAGFSAINRRRAKLTQYPDTSVVVMDGVVAGSSLNDSLAAFTIPLADVRDRGVEVPAFNRANTSTILPRGVLDGYGLFANGEYLVPPTAPLTGVASTSATLTAIRLDGAPTRATDVVDAALVWTKAMADVVTPSTTPSFMVGVFDRVEILWRAVGAPTWNVIRNVRAALTDATFGTLVRDLVEVSPAVIRDARGTKREVRVATHIYFNTGDGGTLPTDGQAVEIILRYAGVPTEQYPFHLETTWGVAVRNLLRGDYSWRPDGTTIDPRIRYDEAALLAFDIPVRLRITKPIKDVRVALEQFCKAIGAAPALNASGEISPIRYELPDASVTLAQIDDTNAVVSAGWEHPTNNAITAVELTYPRDYAMPAESDPDGERSSGDGIATRPVIQRHMADPAVLAVMGEQDVLEIDAWMFRALGGTDGAAVSGDVQDETGAQLSFASARQCLDRFQYGGQVAFARISAADFPTLAVGDWVLDARPWTPNYLTGRRGGNALAQVVSLKRVNPAWYEARLIYAGPADSPLAAPTFDTPTVDADGVVSVDVLTIPTGAEVEVRYATGSQPATNSGEWILLDRTDTTGVITSPALPAGVDVWLQGRSVAPGRRPSAWVAIGDVSTPQTPRFLATRAVVEDDGSVVFHWAANAYVLGVQLRYVTHDADDDPPALSESVDVDAALGTYTLPAGTVGPEDAITYELEPWNGWTGSAVTGSAGQAIRETLSRRPTQHVTGVFVGIPAGAGRVDLSLRVQGWHRAFPVAAEIYAETPDGTPVVTHSFTASGEEIDKLDYAALGGVPVTTTGGLAYWAKLTDALGTVQWIPAVIRSKGTPSVEMGLKNFRETERTETHVTHEWTRGSLVHEVWVKRLLFDVASQPADPWGALPDVPDEVLAIGTDAHTSLLPGPGEIAYLQYEPRAEDLSLGTVQRVRLFGPQEAPTLTIREIPKARFDLADIAIDIVDPGNAAGVLSVWTNPTSDADGAPAGAADDTFVVASTPATVGPTGALEDVKKPLSRSKVIYAQFVTADGRSTPQVAFPLSSTRALLEDHFTEEYAGSIENWMEWGARNGFAPVLRMADLTAIQAITNPITGQRAIAADTDEVYYYDGAAWQPDFDTPPITYAPALSAGIIRVNFLHADVLAATLVQAETVVAAELVAVNASIGALEADVATIEAAYIDAAYINDLIVAGTLIGQSGTFSGTLSAATGTFSGSLSAATGTFGGTVAIDTVAGNSIEFTDPTDGVVGGISASFASDVYSVTISCGFDTYITMTGRVGSALDQVIELNGLVIGPVLDFTTIRLGGSDLQVGAADSGGSGFRMVRVAN